MTHELKTSLGRMIARRRGTLWREHLVDGSVDLGDPEVAVVWSRMWLRRRLRDPGSDGSNKATR